MIDGDTIEIGATTIRLHGIDAPELAQTCTDAQGRAWSCGRWAKRQLAKRLRGAQVSCYGRERDRYGRLVAQCRAGEADLGRWLVLNGMATAYRKYSTAYVAQEAAAKRESRGLWAGQMVAPGAYRANRRQDRQADAAPQADCRIKGNISGNGRLYHLPGSRWYGDTRIDTARGERWFCSEAEARAAGWRRARG
ncbi:thermonuclease family protein [Maritimibacter sp. 55A14]|uniref:thermonuclease family protein n=1 Tax=Maritimibacter sp. 55A14 TaxID=2174844 RepID=UPI001E4E9D45|nr:thermonuclease family protein [Maritimibacter sp. 55A14]